MKKQQTSEPYITKLSAWYGIGILLLAYCVSFIDRQILTLLIIPIQQDLHINDTQIGILHGFTFAIFYSLMGIPIARLLDAGNRKKIIAIGIALWSVMTAYCGLANQYSQLLLARIGVAVGESTLLPGASSLIADWFPAEKRGLPMGIFATGLFLGIGMALIMGGALIALFEGMQINLPLIGDLKPWQMVFITVGLPGVIIALLMLTIPEPRTLVTHKTQNNVKKIPVHCVVKYFSENKQAYGFFFMAVAMATLTGQALAVWTPTFFVREFGWSYTEIGIRLGIVYITLALFAAIIGGWLADVLVKRGYIHGKVIVCLIANFGFIIPGTLYPLVESATLSFTMLVLAVFFSSMVWGVAPAAIQDMTPASMRGQMTAVYGGVINLLGIGLGPFSVGFLTDYVFENTEMMKYSLSYVLCIATVIGSLCYLKAFKPFKQCVNSSLQWGMKQS